MNISLPEALKIFVKERTKKANYSNPSDYVRSLIREDQRRLAATNLLDDMVAKHLAANPEAPAAKLKNCAVNSGHGGRNSKLILVRALLHSIVMVERY